MTRVVLRPVTQKDLDIFQAEFSNPDGTGAYQWFGYRSLLDLQRRFAETGHGEPDVGTTRSSTRRYVHSSRRPEPTRSSAHSA
jgi:hypothetical protein